MRVLMIEPQGEGGICHYAYCLSEALRQEGHDLQLATAQPYELEAAPRDFELAAPFQLGWERRATQRAKTLHRGQRSATGATAPHPSHAANAPAVAADSPLRLARRSAAQWLSLRDNRRGWQRITDLAREKPPAVAHIQWLVEPKRDARWLRTLRRQGVQIVLTAHNVLPHDATEEAQSDWRAIYGGADALIVHYPAAREELAALGIAPERITVIPHGSYRRIQELACVGDRPAMSATEARASLGLPADAPVVLFFGMMRPYKGLDYLLQAFAQVRRELPDARLLLAGRAPAGFDAIQRQIARLGLTDSTVALARYLPLRELARCFLASDVVALPYVEASQSGVLHLAYAFRRPVVATRVGGLPAVIEDGATGLLVPPRDADALAAALRQALADRGQCHRWGERAFAFGEAIGSWREIAARTIEVYQRCTYGPSGD